MKAIYKVDQLASGLMLAGALNSAVTGLTRFSMAKQISGKKKSGMKVYYGILGAATAYKIARLMAPKTKEEKNLMKIAQMYEKADDYKKKAKKYRKTANISFNQSVKQLDKYLRNKNLMLKN